VSSSPGPGPAPADPSVIAAFETSTSRGSVALGWPGGEREALLAPGAPHSETLLPALLRLLAEVGRRPDEVVALAAGVGPGAFTGLRVGLATAQGWGRAAGVPLVAVPSPDALALPVLEEGVEGKGVLVFSDARKGEVYASFYPFLDPSGLPFRKGPVCLLAPSGLRRWWEGLGSPPGVAVGNAVPSALPFLEGEAGLSFSRGEEVPRASAVARLGRRLLSRGEVVPPGGLVPLYVRAPDATLPSAPFLPGP